jgi:hypothetical protein
MELIMELIIELIIESDIYDHSIDENGNYIDYISPSNKFKNGYQN